MTSLYQLPLFPLEKHCTSCGLLKTVSAFAFYHRRGRDGTFLRAKCRECMRAYDRAHWPRSTRAKEIQARREQRIQDPHKRCSRCGLVKARSAFHARKDRPGGLASQCRVCAVVVRRLKYVRGDHHRRYAEKQALWAQGLHQCSSCGEVKPFDAYYRDVRRGHGRQSQCKTCINAKNAAYTVDHLAAYRIYQKHYRRAHSTKMRAYQRVWAKAHPLLRLAKQSRRLAVLRYAMGVYTAADVRTMLHAQRGCCAYCGCEMHFNVPTGQPDKATVDHVVPISRGGSNWPENLVLACARCNSSKGARLPCEWSERPVYEPG